MLLLLLLLRLLLATALVSYFLCDVSASCILYIMALLLSDSQLQPLCLDLHGCTATICVITQVKHTQIRTHIAHTDIFAYSCVAIEYWPSQGAFLAFALSLVTVQRCYDLSPE